MHKLNRSAIPEPPCLHGYDHHAQTWDDFTHDGTGCKRTVRRRLQRMQARPFPTDEGDDEAYEIPGLCCAYCESLIFYGGHIEHFRRKNQNFFPELTFAWTNLFIACASEEHCGHYKDRSSADPYDPDDLIKPDEHDPEDSLYFHSSGRVRIRERDGMTAQDRRRASETIRVFNLDCGTLRGARRRALKSYTVKNPNFLEELMLFETADRLQFITQEIEATRWDPHSSTIRHYFEKAH
jgi:uncharacterized protein (TIGR02646 family)